MSTLDDSLDASRATISPRIARRTHAIYPIELGDCRCIKCSFPLVRTIRRALWHRRIWDNTLQPVCSKRQAVYRPQSNLHAEHIITFGGTSRCSICAPLIRTANVRFTA